MPVVCRGLGVPRVNSMILCPQDGHPFCPTLCTPLPEAQLYSCPVPHLYPHRRSSSSRLHLSCMHAFQLLPTTKPFARRRAPTSAAPRATVTQLTPEEAHIAQSPWLAFTPGGGGGGRGEAERGGPFRTLAPTSGHAPGAI